MIDLNFPRSPSDFPAINLDARKPITQLSKNRGPNSMIKATIDRMATNFFFMRTLMLQGLNVPYNLAFI